MKDVRVEKQMDIENKLNRLSSLLAKYGHRWGENPSSRMCGWVDEFETLRETRKSEYHVWCDKRGFPRDVTAYDCLA